MKAEAATPSSKKDLRPTPDQMYLASKLNGEEMYEEVTAPSVHRISAGALQKWNMKYGVAAVSDALRAAWGFPPEVGIENPYAYVDGILRAER